MDIGSPLFLFAIGVLGVIAVNYLQGDRYED